MVKKQMKTRSIQVQHGEDDEKKIWRSSGYNFNFNKRTGFFMRWGNTFEDDPPFSPFGPEILDLEISSGECQGNCKFCYKCNGSGVETENMSLENFKIILSKMPPTLTQIAFGITNIGSNPDFFPMMLHARNNGIIPNYTCHGLDVNEKIAASTAKLCGAVAVSIVNQEKSYNAIKMFTDAGMDQVNIHFMLSEETMDKALGVIDDIALDPRLSKLNAIVFLQYKPKGKHPNQFHVIASSDRYKKLIEYCESKNVGFGFDSCSAPLYFKAIEGRKNVKQLTALGEPCESFGMFSSYINVRGVYFPCSFCEGENGWEDGIDVLSCDNFIQDIWHSDKIMHWRKIMMHSCDKCDCNFKSMCRTCPIFDVTACKKFVMMQKQKK